MRSGPRRRTRRCGPPRRSRRAPSGTGRRRLRVFGPPGGGRARWRSQRPAARRGLRPNHRRIPGPVLHRANQRLDADPPCTSWSYWRTTQCFDAMLGCASSFNSNPSTSLPTSTPSTFDLRCSTPLHTASRVGIGMPSCRNAIDSRPTSLAVVVEHQRRIARVVGHAEVPRSQNGTLFRVAHRPQCVEMLWGHGEDHALLRFADPDLGVAQALVLERGAVEVDIGADFSPISPTALENPPAPQSVIALNSGPPRRRGPGG